MAERYPIGLGLLGFGTVGGGVVATLATHGELIAERTGVNLVLRAIADLDLESDRGVAVDPALLTTDARAVIARDDVHVVIELIGGCGAARELTLEAFRAGKSVVSANKKLLAEHGPELYEAADAAGVDYLFEASVGGGMPILRALREGLVANHVEGMYGILNGTCNYILTKMEDEGRAFYDVLAEAQALGFAEADPTLDVDGHDTAHKAAVLAGLAYGFHVPVCDIHVKGIRDIAEDDIRFAAEMGYRIKLLGMIEHHDGAVEVSVGPVLVPRDRLLAAVSGEYNAVLVQGDVAGDTLYYGKGAGRDATASAVIADVVEAARNRVTECATRIPAFAAHDSYGEMRRPYGETSARHYLRASLMNEAGVLGKVVTVLGEHGISIQSMIQKEYTAHAFVPVVLLTDDAMEQNLDAALSRIDALDVVQGETVRMRMASF